MGRYKFPLLGGVCLSAALVAACNNAPKSPVSPESSAPIEQAGPGGETLKISAPTPVSPTGGAQANAALALVVANVNGTFASFPVTYRYEIRTPAGAVVTSGTAPAAGGANTSIPVTATLAFDTNYTWRVRAEYNNAAGPWSTDAPFKSGAGGYVRAAAAGGGSEVFDPLTTGISAGAIVGPATFVPGVGLRLETNLPHVRYELPVTLQEGEYSFMATNVDEGNEGDKSKVMSMAEGLGDVTDNDYRASLEVRGRIYTPSPGQLSFRIITGEADDHSRIHDAPRVSVTWNRTDWHFFKIWWRTGQAGYEVRRFSPSGPIVASHTLATSGRPYRPVPHVVYIGAPNTRAGAPNATHAGMTVKNVWVSSSPRPAFPGE